jgi:hypothetical protein
MWMPPFETDLFLLSGAGKISGMDEMAPVCDKLRADGHTVGEAYVQAGGGMLIVIDGVAMSFSDARAVSLGWVTVDQVAQARSAKAPGPQP